MNYTPAKLGRKCFVTDGRNQLKLPQVKKEELIAHATERPHEGVQADWAPASVDGIEP